jgi:hypothetical protein
MELQDSEKRRAVNLIWNAARDYSFEPDFKAYDEEGRADLYWNCIIGAVHRHYDYEKLQALFASFHGCTDEALYEQLLWLGLEGCAFARDASQRPALPALRRSYARHVLALSRAEENDRLLDLLELGHYRRALGQDPGLGPRERELLDALELDPSLDTDGLVRQAEGVLRERFGFAPQPPEDEAPAARRRRHLLFGRRKGAHADLPAVRGFAFGFGEHTYGGTQTGDADQTGFRLGFLSLQTEEGLRTYIERFFGEPLYARRDVDRMERELCGGNHRGCHLYFSRGVRSSELPEGFAGMQKRAVLRQIDRNRAFYDEHLAQSRSSISRLTSRIRNAMQAHMEENTVRSGAGRLDAGRVWRSVYLQDDRIFNRTLRGDTGDLSVDLLLDASTSQLHRQEVIATQGYIIAESLTRCQIPVRVSSFCSMSGYTVVNLFRDYGEKDQNKSLFNYFTTGCNRDGLAIRVAAKLMEKSPCEHRMLIILSDAKPNDVVKVEESGGSWDYTEDVGVRDAAAEVRRARMQGISVICVFTGEDAELPAAHTIYGRDFSRIHSLEQFAETVGGLIQNQIRSL